MRVWIGRGKPGRPEYKDLPDKIYARKSSDFTKNKLTVSL